MGLVETEAIVLKSFNLAEADKIIYLITQTDGIIKGTAKGSRRLKSRFGSILEPFTLIKLDYFQKEERELVSIRDVELIKSYFEFAGHPDFLRLSSYMAELLIEFSPPHEKNDKLYRMTRACFAVISENPAVYFSIKTYFEIWLLRLAGYLPDWVSCVVCQREVELNETTMLQTNNQLACLNCVSSRKDLTISAETRQLFFNVRNKSPIQFAGIIKNKFDELEKISRISQTLIRQILGRELTSQKFLFGILSVVNDETKR